MCLVCNCYFVCVGLWALVFAGVIEDVRGRILKFVACILSSWLLSCVYFCLGVRV